jgi:sulfatase maturation enzyme AslB (radical SAM superfamily)
LLIQTYERSYQVISHVLSNDLGEIYICRDITTDNEYTILRLKDRDIVPDLMVYLNNSIQESFTDFVDRFVYEGDLCLVFKYYRGISLSQKLTYEYCSLSERMTMGKKILDRILLLDMPLYFLKNCLAGERIIVKPSLDISFNYVPSDIHDFAAVDETTALKAFTAIFNMLFAEELLRESVPPINQFYSSLKREQEFNSIELYKQYTQMCREVELIPEEEIIKPKSKWFQLWERVKRFLQFFKKVVGAALLVIAVVYLAYTIDRFANPIITPVKHFEFIGSLEINDEVR